MRCRRVITFCGLTHGCEFNASLVKTFFIGVMRDRYDVEVSRGFVQPARHLSVTMNEAVVPEAAQQFPCTVRRKAETSTGSGIDFENDYWAHRCQHFEGTAQD